MQCPVNKIVKIRPAVIKMTAGPNNNNKANQLPGGNSYLWFLDQSEWQRPKPALTPMTLCILNYIYVSKKHSRGEGVTCHDFSYGCAAGAPGPHPLHILGEVKKTDPFIYIYIENCTHSYTLPFDILFGWKIYPIDILLMRKWYPIHILGGLKSIPHSSRTSAYTFIMDVPPLPLKTLDRKWWKLKKIQINKINVFIDEILLQII